MMTTTNSYKTKEVHVVLFVTAAGLVQYLLPAFGCGFASLCLIAYLDAVMRMSLLSLFLFQMRRFAGVKIGGKSMQGYAYVLRICSSNLRHYPVFLLLSLSRFPSLSLLLSILLFLAMFAPFVFCNYLSIIYVCGFIFLFLSATY